MDTSRILITGSEGLLGRYVPFGIRTSRSDFDIENLEAVRAYIKKHNPEVIFHFAALADVSAAERNPDKAYKTNAVGTYHVALAAQEVKAKLVYISTSAVFDGTHPDPYPETAQPNPQSVYAHSKYLGEMAVRDLVPDHLIVRTCWLFGGGPTHDKKFVGAIMRQRENPIVEVVGGTKGSPTFAKDVIDALLALVESGRRGTFHISNSGSPTRVDIAKEIVTITESSARIQEVDAKTFEQAYPGTVGRGNESITSKTIQLRPWQESLREYLSTEWDAGTL